MMPGQRITGTSVPESGQNFRNPHTLVTGTNDSDTWVDAASPNDADTMVLVNSLEINEVLDWSFFDSTDDGPSTWLAAQVMVSADAQGKIHMDVFDRQSGGFPIQFEVDVIAAVLLGDANNDLKVTGSDLIAVQQRFGTTEPGVPPAAPSGLHLGDANDDGLVTGLDLIEIQRNFGKALAPTSALIPEPSTLLVWMGAVTACCPRPKHLRHRQRRVKG